MQDATQHAHTDCTRMYTICVGILYVLQLQYLASLLFLIKTFLLFFYVVVYSRVKVFLLAIEAKTNTTLKTPPPPPPPRPHPRQHCASARLLIPAEGGETNRRRMYIKDQR
jgi:hypothetical protein